MNKNPFRSRLVSLAVVLGAAALFSAAPASAADLPWQPYQAVPALATHTNMTIKDSEWGGDEVVSNYIPNTQLGLVGYSSKSFTKVISSCGGGEVRAEVEIRGTTNVFQVVNLQLRAKLYEGSSCNTMDLDGITPWKYVTLRPGGGGGFADFVVKNDDEGWDRADIGMNLYMPKVL